MMPRDCARLLTLNRLSSPMTGFAALPLAQEEGADPNSARKFKGTSRILGPRWANLPTLTIGLLGVQIFWSVEMSYGMSLGSLYVAGADVGASFAVSYFSRIEQVEHGHCFRSWAAIWADNAAVNW